MLDFLKWAIAPENINANIFTLFSVVLSGIVSWIISAVYFRISNRNALKSTILHPVRRLLEETPSLDNYRTIIELTKERNIKYLKENEQEILDKLLLAYKDVCRYNYETVCAESLSSYFKYKLKKNGIDPSPIPVYIEDEIVDMDFPTDMLYFVGDLERVITQYPPEYDTENCKNAVVRIFKFYCKTCYSVSDVTFFDDYSIDEVLKQAKNRSEWDSKFNKYKTTKESFVNMKSLN